MHIPTTSKTLLRNLGEDARSARWTEFVARYRPMMEAFLAARFLSLASEAEDVIQETLLVLVRALPGYRYSPGETGSPCAASRWRTWPHLLESPATPPRKSASA